MDAQNRVQWIYSSRDNQELAERYDQWDKDYDADLERDFAWAGPQRAAEVLVRHLAEGARILDAGAGTGLVGQILYGLGYRDLVAMDLSLGMLEEARNKKVYREFHQMVMGEPLDFGSDTFDAVVSVGVLTVGHAPAGSLDELVRITRPGGFIAFSLRPDIYQDAGFKEKQQALEDQGSWKLTEVTDPFQPLPKGEPEVYHQVWVYLVSG